MVKKKHHYIPVFYFRGFVNPKDGENIYVYEKGNSQIRSSKPENTDYINYYHSFCTKKGKDTDTIENYLEKTESKVTPIIEKIERREKLSPEERWMFSYFIALMMVRVPNFRNNIETVMANVFKDIHMTLARHKEGFYNSIKNYERETGNSLGDPEELRQFALKGKYDVKVNPELSLSMLLKGPLGYANIFSGMRWFFLVATHDYKFVTSDNPLFYDDPSRNTNSILGVGLLDKNIELTFPISKDLALLAIWKNDLKEDYIQQSNFVKKTTLRTVISAKRFVYASERSKTINRMVQKFKNSSPEIRII